MSLALRRSAARVFWPRRPVPALPRSRRAGDVRGHPHEREIVSVVHLTCRDGGGFLALAPRVPVRTHVVPYPLERTNEALADLRAGRLRGAAVLTVAPEQRGSRPASGGE